MHMFVSSKSHHQLFITFFPAPPSVLSCSAARTPSYHLVLVLLEFYHDTPSSPIELLLLSPPPSTLSPPPPPLPLLRRHGLRATSFLIRDRLHHQRVSTVHPIDLVPFSHPLHLLPWHLPCTPPPAFVYFSISSALPRVRDRITHPIEGNPIWRTGPSHLWICHAAARSYNARYLACRTTA
ncbi:hypothetical protein LY76DRAFT_225637 [Colletotrichum caudatum]|nr:hypothetical protein LY76DRAFT_225637 [Colletotrichum caudatum]